jgi:ADP-ribosylglycohydrolase
MESIVQGVKAILEAFAVGDAMGMPTEFMTRKEIIQTIGNIEGFVDPALSKNHGDLPFGTITDDTEQNMYLINAYTKAKTIDEPVTTKALLAWIEESDAVAKRYIGPSSLKALRAIEAGTDPKKAGTGGTTCGGLMRTLSAVLCTPTGVGYDTLAKHIEQCLMSTHYTSQALEAACAYGFALYSASCGDSFDEVMANALNGANMGLELAPYHACAASSAQRIVFLQSMIQHDATFQDDDRLLDFLFDVLGTGLESADVCAAVFALFMRYPKDPWKAICLASTIGGDTDTIAALVGALCCAHRGSNNIPRQIIDYVATHNNLDFMALATSIAQMFEENN